jgi:ribonuclease E
MTVVDVNTGKYTGSGGNLEQTVTRNNLEAAEEIVRQLRLRDIGGIVVIDFIDMVLESNRELVLRRLTECLGRDRTKHQVAEVTSLGLVQMTRKRVGEGLLEAFSEPCSVCNGRGVLVHLDSIDRKSNGAGGSAAATAAVEDDRPARGRRSRKAKADPVAAAQAVVADLAAEADKRRAAANAVAAIAAATTNNHAQEPVAAVGSADDDHGRATDQPVTGQSSDVPAGPDEALTVEPAGQAQPPTAEPALQAQPPTAEPADEAQPPTVEPAGRAQPPTGEAEPPAGGPAQPPRRRRRAASRPAGPPVPVSSLER